MKFWAIVSLLTLSACTPLPSTVSNETPIPIQKIGEWGYDENKALVMKVYALPEEIPKDGNYVLSVKHIKEGDKLLLSATVKRSNSNSLTMYDLYISMQGVPPGKYDIIDQYNSRLLSTIELK